MVHYLSTFKYMYLWWILLQVKTSCDLIIVCILFIVARSLETCDSCLNPTLPDVRVPTCAVSKGFDWSGQAWFVPDAWLEWSNVNTKSSFIIRILKSRQSKAFHLPLLPYDISLRRILYQGPKIWFEIPHNLGTLNSMQSFNRKFKYRILHM